MIINETFFHGVIKIDGIFSGGGTPEATTSATIGMLNSYIERFEPMYLIGMLGGEMSRLFMNYIYNEDGNKAAVERWDKLKEQLVFGHPKRPISPIAEYVYYHYVDGRQIAATSEGATVQQAKPANPTKECISAWNRMAEINKMVGVWLHDRRDVYPEWRENEDFYRAINIYGI